LLGQERIGACRLILARCRMATTGTIPAYCRACGVTHAMKAALTVWNGRVSPVFDVSREAVVLRIEDGSVAALWRESLDTPNASLKVDRVVDLGIDVLVCGAISESLHRELCARSVTVYGFVAGEIEQVIDALLAGALPASALSMPGCAGRRQRRRRGHNEEPR